MCVLLVLATLCTAFNMGVSVSAKAEDALKAQPTPDDQILIDSNVTLDEEINALQSGDREKETKAEDGGTYVGDPMEVTGSYHVDESVTLIPSLQSLGEGVQLTSTPKVTDNKKLTIPVKYKVGPATVSMTVTYWATGSYLYDYDEHTIPNGNMKIQDHITITVSTQNEGKIDLMELYNTQETEPEKELMIIGIDSEGQYGITGTIKVSVKASLIGNFTVSFVRQRGCRVDGGWTEPIDEGIDENFSEQQLMGKFFIGVSGGVALKLPVLGDVFKCSMSMGITVGFNQKEQYDKNVRCFDVPVSFDISMNITAKIALSMPKGSALEGLSWTLISKTLPLYTSTLQLCIGHIEMRYSPSGGAPFPGSRLGRVYACGVLYINDPNQNYRVDEELCSVPVKDRRTFQFYTGTEQKYENVNAVVGQTIDRPQNPDRFNDRVFFIDWYTSATDGEPYQFDQAIEENTESVITLYARWSEPYYNTTIDFDIPGVEPTIHACPPGVKLEEPIIPLRMNYHFENFVAEVPGDDGNVQLMNWNFDSSVTLNKDIKIVVQWRYEEGYDPFKENVEQLENNPAYAESILNEIQFERIYSTGMSGTCAGRVSTSLWNELYMVAKITNYPGTSPVLIIPEKIGGTVVTWVDGRNFTNKEAIQGLVLPPTVQVVEGFADFPNLGYVVMKGGSYKTIVYSDVEKEFEGVTLIEDDCFRNCKNLHHVVIPSSIQYLGDYAFAGSGLQEFSFDYNNRIFLGEHIFSDCTQLYKMDFPSTIHTLTTGILQNCTALKNFDTSQFTTFQNACLQNTGIEQFKASNVVYFGQDVFRETPVKNVEISFCRDGFSHNFYAFDFYHCPDLQTISLDGAPDLSLLGCPEVKSISIKTGKLNDLDLDQVIALEELKIEGPVECKIYLDEKSSPSLQRITITDNVKDISLYRLPELEQIYIGGKAGSIHVDDLPKLTSLHFALLDNDDEIADLTLRNCPKLRNWDGLLGGNVEGTLEGLGLTSLEVSDFKELSLLGNLPGIRELDLTDLRNETGWGHSLKIKDMPSLTAITLPSDSGIGISMEGSNPSLRTVISPADRDKIALYNYRSNGAITRFIVKGDNTALEGANNYDHCILVAKEGSKAWQDVAGYSNVLRLTPEEASSVWAMGIQSYGSLGWGTASIPELGVTIPDDETLWIKLPAGAPIPHIDFIPSDSASFMGWYLDEASGEQAMPMTYAVMPARDFLIRPQITWETQYQFTMNEDGTITLLEYLGTQTEVVVPQTICGYTVTAIHQNAFAEKQIERITLPNTLATFDPKAFSELDSLKSLHIHNAGYVSVDGAVYGRDAAGNPGTLLFCPKALAGTLQVPDTVTVVADGALTECNALTRLVFLNDATLGNDAIQLCFNLQLYGPVEAPNLTAWCDANAYDYNMYTIQMHFSGITAERSIRAGESLAGLVLESNEGYLFLGWAADPNAEASEVLSVMPAEDIDVWPVWNCSYQVENGVLISLEQSSGTVVIIPDGVIAIAEGAVTYKAERIRIPSSVTEIAENAFVGTPIIEGDMDSYAYNWALAHGCAFEERVYTVSFETNGGSELGNMTRTAAENTVLPTPVKTWSVFTGWYLDEALTQPVDAAGLPARNVILYASWNETAKMEFTYRENGENTVELTGYQGTDAVPLVPAVINGKQVTAIAEGAFAQNRVLYRLELPESIRNIGERAFYGSSLANIKMNAPDVTLGRAAFAECSMLVQVELPNGLTTLPEEAFRGCTVLTALQLPDSLVSIEKNALQGCSNLKTLDLPIGVVDVTADSFHGSGLRQINTVENAAFKSDGACLYTADGKTLVYICAGVKTVEVASGVTTIAARAAYQLPLNSITLPDSLRTVGDQALYSATLASIAIPDNLDSAGEEAFFEDTELLVSSAQAAAYPALKDRFRVVLLDSLVVATDLQLDQTTLSLPVGQTVVLTALLTPSNANDAEVLWRSMDVNVAEVEAGTVRALGVGETVIYAYTQHGLEAACVVTVTEGCELSVQTNNGVLWRGVENQLNVACSDSEATIKYYCDALMSDLQISSDGVVTVKKRGTYTIRVEAVKDGLVYAKRELTLEVKEPCISVDLSKQFETIERQGKTYYYVEKGYSRPIESEVFQPNEFAGESVVFESSNPDLFRIERSEYSSYFNYTAQYKDGYAELKVTLVATGEEKTYLICVGNPPESGNWSDPVYTWADDYRSVTASRYDMSNPSNVESETVQCRVTVLKAPTKTERGSTAIISDAFENSAFSQQYYYIYDDIPCLNDLSVAYLPDNLQIIDDEAFAGMSFDAIIVPPSCTEVGYRAFADCKNLIYLSVPYYTRMPEDALEGCDNVRIERYDIR